MVRLRLFLFFETYKGRCVGSFRVLAVLCICVVNGSLVREQLKASVSQHYMLDERADRAISILSLLFVNGLSNESRKKQFSRTAIVK